jgi:molybdopterin-containing oxidoreductase family iron-sulfur binding subunit
MVVDVDKCTECMEELIAETGNPNVKPPCVVACDIENNVPEFEDKLIDPQWMRIAMFRLKLDTVEGEEFYMPLLCNHCEHPPCAQVCITKATFKRPDGIVKIDYHKCIGCRYCMIACPYGARTFNWKDPKEGLDYLPRINPEVQIRGHGIVEKCTFCDHRIDPAVARGENPVPACVEACIERAKELGWDGPSLVFGNIKDKSSEVYKIVSETKVTTLRPQLGTQPHVFYWNILR